MPLRARGVDAQEDFPRRVLCQPPRNLLACRGLFLRTHGGILQIDDDCMGAAVECLANAMRAQEIGDMPLSMQTRLLRVLAER